MTVNFSTRLKKSWILDVTSDDATYWSTKYIGKVILEKTTRGFLTQNSKTPRQNFSKNSMIAIPRNLVPSDARTLRTTRTQCIYGDTLCLHLSTGLGKENLSLSSLSNKSSSLTLETNRQT